MWGVITHQFLTLILSFAKMLVKLGIDKGLHLIIYFIYDYICMS